MGILTADAKEILAGIPPQIWYDVGATQPPLPVWNRPAGVYEMPFTIPHKHRIVYSVLATGEQIDFALIAPGGDYYACKRHLRSRLIALLASEDPRSAHLRLVP